MFPSVKLILWKMQFLYFKSRHGHLKNDLQSMLFAYKTPGQFTEKLKLIQFYATGLFM